MGEFSLAWVSFDYLIGGGLLWVGLLGFGVVMIGLS